MSRLFAGGRGTKGANLTRYILMMKGLNMNPDPVLYLVCAFKDREARAWANDHNIAHWKLVNKFEHIQGHIEGVIIRLKSFGDLPKEVTTPIIEYAWAHKMKHANAYDPLNPWKLNNEDPENTKIVLHALDVHEKDIL
jgi:hypothetical protein